jgi:hypothetical protein
MSYHTAALKVNEVMIIAQTANSMEGDGKNTFLSAAAATRPNRSNIDMLEHVIAETIMGLNRE